MDAGNWYLEVNGKKVGPFTLDQIQGFLDDGEIRAYHQVTSHDLGGRWLSVEDALQAAPPPPPAPVSIPTAFDGSFQPPPRPEIQASGPMDDRTDPAISLFNALQVMRERRVAAIHPPSVKSSPARGPLLHLPSFKFSAKLPDFSELRARIRELIPAQFANRMILVAVFAGIVLGSLTWGFVRLLRDRVPPSGKLTEFGGHVTPHAETEAPKIFTRPTEPGRFIPPPPPAALHVAPITRPNFQQVEPPPQNPPPATDYATTPPPEQNAYPPPEPQQQQFQDGTQMAAPQVEPLNGDPNVQQVQPPPPPADAPGQDNFPPPPTQ